MPLHKLYPLKFDPILKERPWGGSALPLLKKMRPDDRVRIGESWEISGLPGNVSVVGNGSLQGKTLNELIELYGSSLVGREVFERFGNHFPLLIKLIDAQEDLSIQVHPDDELAMKRHGCPGKTEMWVVLYSKPEASIYAGFKQPASREVFSGAVQNRTLPTLLRKEKVTAGDLFYIPAGTVHAIGKGSLILEIQQASDITYRIDDRGRSFPCGTFREMHIDLATDAIDFSGPDTYRINQRIEPGVSTAMHSCRYFRVNLRHIEGPSYYSPSGRSFVVFFCVEGRIRIKDGRGFEGILSERESVLIPAGLDQLQLNGSASFLEISV